MTRITNKTTARTSRKFVVCINNEDYPASLEIRKIYQVLPDSRSAALKMLRVIDESGEDYLFPAELFVPIRLTESIRNALSLAA